MESFVSVIIPTYNRVDSVLRTLNSLCQQTLSPTTFEVIVVDDGSTDDVSIINSSNFPLNLYLVNQRNQGATIARNNGALHSRGDVLIFIDDDVTISLMTLEILADACTTNCNVLAMGTLVTRSVSTDSIYTSIAIAETDELINPYSARTNDNIIHFSHCNTQLLAVRREDFYELGMLKDPTGGWPNWDDVDFGYRSYLAGFRLLQCAKAVGEHWDYSFADLNTACKRWQRASKSAVRLFQRHPGLQLHIPMFHDKTPIARGKDPLSLIFRKVARQCASFSIASASMEIVARLLERYYPNPDLLRPLYRWIIGGYMFRGYREGLRETG